MPPGLPSSVSGRSVFPAGIPSPFLHPLGIPAAFATKAASPVGPGTPNIEGLDFSRMGKGFLSYSFLRRRNEEKWGTDRRDGAAMRWDPPPPALAGSRLFDVMSRVPE